MNKQKAIEILKNADTLTIQDTRTSNLVDMVIKSDVIATIELIDETQKPVIPQFVADWYEENKDDFEFNVWNWIAFRNEPEKLENKEFNSWINDGEGNPIQILVNMHQFGYEVEKEKRYLVRIRATKHYFAKDGNRRIYFSLAYKSCFTKKELEEANFGWVFDCPGIEIEEVEE